MFIDSIKSAINLFEKGLISKRDLIAEMQKWIAKHKGG